MAIAGLASLAAGAAWVLWPAPDVTLPVRSQVASLPSTRDALPPAPGRRRVESPEPGPVPRLVAPEPEPPETVAARALRLAAQDWKPVENGENVPVAVWERRIDDRLGELQLLEHELLDQIALTMDPTEILQAEVALGQVYLDLADTLQERVLTMDGSQSEFLDLLERRSNHAVDKAGIVVEMARSQSGARDPHDPLVVEVARLESELP